jgi:transcriptional regulator with XRE-family HTH domain
MSATSHLTLKDEATIARARAKSLGLSQQTLAAAIGIEQSQVSRLLSGQIVHRTAAFDALCKYLDVHGSRVKDGAALPAEIRDAINSTWDGTETHAVALATVIRALGVLTTPPVKISK